MLVDTAINLLCYFICDFKLLRADHFLFYLNEGIKDQKYQLRIDGFLSKS